MRMPSLTPFCFTLIAAAGGALAEPAFLTEPGAVHVLQMTGHETADQVILFSVGPDLRAGGDVLAEDGSASCPAKWSAKLVSGASGPRFEDIALTLPDCADRAALEELADRLGRVRQQSVGEEGVTLLDAEGAALLQLTIAG